MSATAAPRSRRCGDGFLISSGLCVVPGCEANGYETRKPSSGTGSTFPNYDHAANGRTARIMAKISTDWAPFNFTGDTAERNRDSARLARLVECRRLQRRPGTGGRVEYRRDV